MADKNHTLATRFLNYSGFVTRSDQTERWSTTGDTGRADIFVAKYGMAVNVEVKFGATSFRHYPAWNNQEQKWTGGWHWKQRRWALTTTSSPFCIPYWIFLTMGKHPAHYNPDKYVPKKTWLISFTVFHEKILQVEEAGMKSFPYEAVKGTRKVFQDNKWDANTMFKGFELIWAKSKSLVRPFWYGEKAGELINEGMWITPDDHPFHQRHILSNPTEIECLDEYTADKRNMYDEIIASKPPEKFKSEDDTKEYRLKRVKKRKTKRKK